MTNLDFFKTKFYFIGLTPGNFEPVIRDLVRMFNPLSHPQKQLFLFCLFFKGAIQIVRDTLGKGRQSVTGTFLFFKI